MTGERREFTRAVVTGASVGIGAAFANQLARAGTDLVLIARNGEQLAALARELESRYGISATPMAADLTKRADVEAIERMIEQDDDLDLLVNNAGFGTIGPFAELDIGAEIAEIELNVIAVVRLTRAALPALLRRNRGAIINVASLAAFQPGPFNATYAATKAYLKSFTESVAEELRTTGVRLQVLCPGFTRTEFQARAGLDTSGVPSFAWMTAEQVVEQSLRDLRSGTLVSIPGLGNRALAGLTKVVPDRALRRLAGIMVRRTLGH